MTGVSTLAQALRQIENIGNQNVIEAILRVGPIICGNNQCCQHYAKDRRTGREQEKPSSQRVGYPC